MTLGEWTPRRVTVWPGEVGCLLLKTEQSDVRRAEQAHVACPCAGEHHWPSGHPAHTLGARVTGVEGASTRTRCELWRSRETVIGSWSRGSRREHSRF